MMTAPVPQSLSQLSWVQHYGTRHCHMMETLSSWNTWTWKNSSQKMAFHPAQTSTSLAHTSQVSSKLPQHHLLSWTSAAGLLLQSIQAWCRRTACRARSDQVRSCQQTGTHRAPLILRLSKFLLATSLTLQILLCPAFLARRCSTPASASSPKKSWNPSPWSRKLAKSSSQMTWR